MRVIDTRTHGYGSAAEAQHAGHDRIADSDEPSHVARENRRSIEANKLDAVDGSIVAEGVHKLGDGALVIGDGKNAIEVSNSAVHGDLLVWSWFTEGDKLSCTYVRVHTEELADFLLKAHSIAVVASIK